MYGRQDKDIGRREGGREKREEGRTKLGGNAE